MENTIINKLEIEKLAWEKMGGLLPAVVQDAADGRVLMLGYMNREALEHSLSSGRVTFFSRSRNRLWTKGETSGNTLELRAIVPDCDNDALLVQAIPRGSTCHRGTETCFGNTTWPDVGFLATLEQVIRSRRGADPETSYTAHLLKEGIERCAQKVGEEGVETALAAVVGDRERLNDEAADLVYHLLVCLEAAGTDLAKVVQVLRERHRC